MRDLSSYGLNFEWKACKGPVTTTTRAGSGFSGATSRDFGNARSRQAETR